MEKDPPEIVLGRGNKQVALRGREAIRAGGTAVWYYLMARAIQNLAAGVLLAIASVWLFRAL